jgi:hypothetical protein
MGRRPKAGKHDKVCGFVFDRPVGVCCQGALANRYRLYQK